MADPTIFIVTGQQSWRAADDNSVVVDHSKVLSGEFENLPISDRAKEMLRQAKATTEANQANAERLKQEAEQRQREAKPKGKP